MNTYMVMVVMFMNINMVMVFMSMNTDIGSVFQVVKVHSIKINAPSTKGPKTIRIFKNQPRTLDFSQAESMTSIQVLYTSQLVTTYVTAFPQDLELSGSQLEGKEIPLKFVKFQDVQNIQFFVKDNQTGEEVTQIDFLDMFGSPKQTTNMKELKKAG